MDNSYTKDFASALTAAGTDPSKGLSESRASEALSKYGKNRLQETGGRKLWQIFADQFKDFLVIILIIAAIVSVFIGQDLLEGLIIIAIVILNSILGTYQENRAGNALKALKRLSGPQAKVLRDGHIVKLQSDMVVPGDIVVIEAGDYIAADMRLIESVNLKIDESALTGESDSVEKDCAAVLPEGADLGDRVNGAYMGTVVTYGRGRGVVTATGMNTEIGGIARMLSEQEDESTPLQKRLDSLGKQLGIACIVICVLIFGVGLLRRMDIFDMFMVSVSLAVAAIPEGLTIVVTVILALGMQKMVKKNAIIKRLGAVETLGSTTVICSDKTGTLTQNKMTVVKSYGGEAMLHKIGVLCNDASSEDGVVIGDPTEAALIEYGKKAGYEKEALERAHARVDEIPFDSQRKMMSTFHKNGENTLMCVKGAPDEIIARAAYYLDKDGSVRPVTYAFIGETLAVIESYAKEALRVLAVAYRELDGAEAMPERAGDDPETGLIFAGLYGMIDPPREEAARAVALCKSAGIKVKMITGDHKDTASAIARQIGIIPAEDGESAAAGAVSGREIDAMTDDELKAAVENVNVFARVSPEHKVRLVGAIKENGEIVAMTGDGVNDAPSLKRADIGIAMGISGTDVSKEAADMILTDDNFASIERAVEEGRVIYNNIRKVVGYLVSCNIGEILIVAITMLAGFPVPLAPIQLLSINLFTDAFPAFALGMEKGEKGVMQKPPRSPSEPIVDKSMLITVAVSSVCNFLGYFAAFFFGMILFDLKEAMTACFVTVVLGELLRAYSSRFEFSHMFRRDILKNFFLNNSTLVSIAFLLATVYIPFLNPIFKTVPLNPLQLLFCLGFALFTMLGGELSKVVKRIMIPDIAFREGSSPQA